MVKDDALTEQGRTGPSAPPPGGTGSGPNRKWLVWVRMSHMFQGHVNPDFMWYFGAAMMYLYVSVFVFYRSSCFSDVIKINS